MFHCKALSALSLVLALSAAPAFADDKHHPAGSPPAATTAPQPMQGMGQGTQSGMAGMGQGGMQGMPMMGMREGAAQQPGMPMMGGMMCGMMQGGMAGMGQGSGGGMPMMAGRTEGRIAFLKAELKITDTQLALWNAVADAIRTNAKSAIPMMDTMNKASLPERLAAREKSLTAQAEASRKVKGAVDLLYAALSDEQKKTADEILMSAMGMM